MIEFINPFPDSSMLKEFADDNFQFVENSRKFSNTVGKGKFACYKQFLLFPECYRHVKTRACLGQTDMTDRHFFHLDVYIVHCLDK